MGHAWEGWRQGPETPRKKTSSESAFPLRCWSFARATGVGIAMLFAADILGSQETLSPADEARAFYARGRAHLEKYEWNEALAAYEEARRLCHHLGAHACEAESLYQMGLVYYSQTRYEEAAPFWEKAHALYEKAGHEEGVGRTLSVLGIAHQGAGNYAEALSFYERGLAFAEKSGHRSNMALALNNMGSAAWHMGDYRKALAHYERGLSIAAGADDKEMTAYATIGLGAIYKYLGDGNKAMTFYRRSAEAAVAAGNQALAAAAFNNMGEVCRERGEHEQAMRYYERGLAIMRETGNKGGEAALLGNIALVQRDVGRFAEALAHLEKSLALRQEINDHFGAAAALANLCHESFGAPETRLPYGERALDAARRADSPEMIYGAHMVLGRISALAGKRADALRHFRSAVDTAESMRSLLSEGEMKSGFLGTKMEAYEGLVELLTFTSSELPLERTREADEEAFSVAERMKARSFLDELGAAKFSRAGVSEELLREKRLLEARIKWLRERP